MPDDNEMTYQGAVDELDVRYENGIAYMSIHTIDTINASLMEMLDAAALATARSGREFVTPEMAQGAVWVMSVWQDLHDELDIRASAKNIPDHIPSDLLDD